MHVSSATYIKKHLTEESWKKTTTEKNPTEIFSILVTLIAMRAIDKTSDFNTIIQKGLYALKTIIFSQESKKRLEILKILHREISSPRAAKEILAKIKKVKLSSATTVKEDHPILFTTQVHSPRLANRLKSILELWCKKALVKAAVIKALPKSGKKEKRRQALDSLRIIITTTALIHQIALDAADQSIYIAYDKNRTVHAIALTSLNEKTNQTIDYLVTNPDDLDILGTEERVVRGSGSALIRHISKNVLLSKKINRVSLSPVGSAIPFYEKLGFSFVRKKMILRKPGIRSLVKNIPPTHIPLQEEPSSYLKE